jgi:hypothetical protein
MSMMWPKSFAPDTRDYNVYYRTDNGKLGHFLASGQVSHKEAILTVQEALVAEGDCLTNKAVLAVIQGGKDAQ